jgi:hypothetical protein
LDLWADDDAKKWVEMTYEERFAWASDCLPSAGHATLTEIASAATADTRDDVLAAYWDFIDNGL